MSLLSRHLQKNISLFRFQILSFSDCSLEFERIFVFSFFKSFFYLKISNNENIILCNVFTFQNKKCLENLDHNGCIQICNGRIPELWKDTCRWRSTILTSTHFDVEISQKVVMTCIIAPFCSVMKPAFICYWYISNAFTQCVVLASIHTIKRWAFCASFQLEW